MSAVPQFLCPRIRLTKTDKSHAILPVDAITGIEEDLRGKCVRVNTLDGFCYEVVNPILEIDKKIDEAIMQVNGAVPIVMPPNAEMIIPKSGGSDVGKTIKDKAKRMLSAGVEKITKGSKTNDKGQQADASSAPPKNIENSKKEPDAKIPEVTEKK